MGDTVRVYLETGDKRIFAGAVEWPGWARSGRTRDDALAALAAYRDRYAPVLAGAHLRPPPSVPEFEVVHELAGGSGRELVVAAAAPPEDDEPLTADDLERSLRFLDAAWSAFDAAAETAR